MSDADGSRLQRIEQKLDALVERVTAHIAREEGSHEATADAVAKKSKWIDRAWTLGVCLAGCAVGFLLKR